MGNYVGRFLSPLRYPGGKSRISTFLEDIILLNNLEGCSLYELYAGGAGASLKLLQENICNKLVLNDLDFHIYAFWNSVLNHTEQLIKLINDTDVTLDNWYIQNDIYNNYQEHELLQVGFSTFYLNRTNRSGILFKAGPIGGREQKGEYKIGARYNKVNLIKRIETIAQLRDKIEIHNLETLFMLKEVLSNKDEDKFIYLDPPYYVQGKHLYLNFYEDSDHLSLQNILSENKDEHWILTYDNCDRINDLYNEFRRCDIKMMYSMQDKKESKEVMIFSNFLRLPDRFSIGKKEYILEVKGT